MNCHYVVFESEVVNLIIPNTNDALADIFVRYTQTPGSIARFSVDNLDAQSNAANHRPAISANGRYVSFTTPSRFNDMGNNGKNGIYRS